MRSSMIVLGLVIASGGCGFQASASESDAPTGESCTTFSSQFDTCALTLAADLMVSGTTYDTGTHELRINGTLTPVAHMTLTGKAGGVDAILVRNVTISAGAGFRVTGPLPFAIVAGGSVTLEDGASIDVGHGGAGAQTSCASPPTAGENSAGGGAGGGGGGYGAAGGKGGNGNGNATQSVGGMPGGALAIPAGPLGGCPGAHGGEGDAPGNGGVGGLGGGALYVVAAERITLGNGAALTSGGGGGGGGGHSGATGDAGGGGGGSGGMIVLESAHVVGLMARVAANGGGGGEGSEDAAAGDHGDDGGTSTSRAVGGSDSSPNSTDGGRGGSQEVAMGEMAMGILDGGGGGGGGGVGFIHIVSPDVHLGIVSPAAQ